MKKFIYSIFLALLFLLISITVYLFVFGIETSKFNNLIISEVGKKDPNAKIELDKIKIKFDIKKIQIHLSTYNPRITYQDIKIPITEINIYSKISSFLKSKAEINQTIFSLKNFNIQDVQKIAVRIKPSNFKNYLLNNLNGGKIEKILVDLKIDKDFKIIDYKVNGAVKKINIKISDNFLIQDINLNFKSDKNLTLINSINANYEGISVSNGSINLQHKKDIEIEGEIDSQFNFKTSQINKLFTKINLKFLEENKINIQGNLLHKFNLKINENFKLIDYDYKSSGNISDSQIILKDNFKSNFIEKPINKISFSKTKLEINVNKKSQNLLMLDGLYNTGDSGYKKFKINNDLNKKNSNYFIDFDLNQNIFFELINFKSNFKDESNIKGELSIENNNFIFKYINFIEDKNSISINGLKLNDKKEIEMISSINVLTFNNNKENNNFKINFKDKISVVGEKYDSTHLLKLISSENKINPLKNFSRDIEIKLKSLITKSQIPLSDFNLIGVIEKGKFNKVSLKGNFTKKEYLDISIKKDVNNKKILEIYSDLPQALLVDYKFFEGINGGKLLYRSVIDKTGSVSKLTIENFKVLKAPAFATLLTLADLRGVADLLSGEGMSFDYLEINLKNDQTTTTVDEILALGKSVSLQMDGYVEKQTGLISLRGTLVPAKTLNSLISKIPLIGNILVGSKVGEGVFGVSFKMKGLPANIKTSINPVKTLTPRFITRVLEKMKKNQ